MKERIVKHKVIRQGKPIVNAAILWKNSNNMKLISVDLKSKYCEVMATSTDKFPEICITTNENSLYLLKRRGDTTIIGFPEFKGWTCIMAEISKYTLLALLIKPTK